MLCGGSGKTTWAWDGNNWRVRSVNTNPGRQWFPKVAYDTKQDQMLMVTLLPSETWLYVQKPRSPARVVTYGKGCRGATLDSANGQLPWVGSPLAR